MIRLAAWVLSAIVLAGGAGAQETRPESRSDPAETLLREVDARIYSAERAGMTSVEFSYRPSVSGTLELTPFRVRVRWEKGQRETVDFVQPDGTAFAELPAVLRQPAAQPGAPSMKDEFERGARSLVALFRGQPYSEQFRTWNKQLERQTVNGRERRTIICEPKVGQYLQRVEIAIDDRSLPWRITSVLTRADSNLDRLIDEPSWKDFDGTLLLDGFKKLRGSHTEQIVMHYQRKDGFIVPSSYERQVPGKPPERTVFEDVVVNKK